LVLNQKSFESAVQRNENVFEYLSEDDGKEQQSDRKGSDDEAKMRKHSMQ